MVTVVAATLAALAVAAAGSSQELGSKAKRKPTSRAPTYVGHPRKLLPPGAVPRTQQTTQSGGVAQTWVEIGPTAEGLVEWARRRPSTWKGRSVHALVKLPAKDYPWLTETDAGWQCLHCGSTLAEETFGVTWAEGKERVRTTNPGGGYRSRGPILWAMRALKFERFGLAHMSCAADYHDLPPIPPDIIWTMRLAPEATGPRLVAEAAWKNSQRRAAAWKDWEIRRDTWQSGVRRVLRRTYAKGGASDLDRALSMGVRTRGWTDAGERGRVVWPGFWDGIPF